MGLDLPLTARPTCLNIKAATASLSWTPFIISFYNEFSPQRPGNMLFQVVRFTLLSSLTLAAPAVSKLCQHVSNAGASRQYLGYMMSTQSLSLPKKRDEICWIICMPLSDFLSTLLSVWLISMHVVWRKNFTAADKPVLVGLDQITQGEPTTMLYEFDDSHLEQLIRGIEAPICEFVR